MALSPPFTLSAQAADGTSPIAVEVYGGGFDSYVRGHAHALARGAFLLTGDRQLAEDLVQTALAKVAPRWDRLVERGDPTAYLRKVMVHTAIGWRRRRWHGETPTLPLPETAGADPTLNIDSRERLRVALLQLPPRQRAAVILRFYEDLGEAAVANAMGCSVGTVKSQTAKGLARLRALLDEQRSPSSDPHPLSREVAQ